MKKYYCTKVLLISACLIFLRGSICQALDESGCLTCHQYPGLVRLEKNANFKPLHIDEEKYVKSAHGKVLCTKCHTTVIKVPHTGETRVDCTTATCHPGKDPATLIKETPGRPFHVQEQSFITDLKDESSCRVCHTLYPHSANELVRALLNMHTGFMFCDVCHIKRGKYIGLAYEWRDTENASFKGDPFGTYFNPHTRKAHKSDHFISRIEVIAIENGKKRDLMNTGDAPQAKAFKAQEKQMDPIEKKNRLDNFHRDVERKEISAACNECHSAGGILNFEQLGFDPKNTDHLVNLNIKGLVTKYKTFYFPKMFGN